MSRITTKIIHESPYAEDAANWEALLARLEQTEYRLGWRYIWEGDFSRSVEAARLQAQENYRRVIDWEPEIGEMSVRMQLMDDLCAYERAFYSIGRAIAGWPKLASHVRSPSIARLIR